jgi:hypothetical protein
MSKILAILSAILAIFLAFTQRKLNRVMLKEERDKNDRETGKVEDEVKTQERKIEDDEDARKKALDALHNSHADTSDSIPKSGTD